MKTTILLVLSFASLVAPRLPGAAGAQPPRSPALGCPVSPAMAVPHLRRRSTTHSGSSSANDGDIYFCDTGNHAIRKIDRQTGVITTIAGTGGENGYSGDGGRA